jgi:hypothetical protein
MNDVVCHLRDLAAHFLSRSQMQLDTFAGAALKKADDSRVRLRAGLILRERAQITAVRIIARRSK